MSELDDLLEDMPMVRTRDLKPNLPTKITALSNPYPARTFRSFIKNIKTKVHRKGEVVFHGIDKNQDNKPDYIKSNKSVDMIENVLDEAINIKRLKDKQREIRDDAFKAKIQNNPAREHGAKSHLDILTNLINDLESKQFSKVHESVKSFKEYSSDKVKSALSSGDYDSARSELDKESERLNKNAEKLEKQSKELNPNSSTDKM